ncbi:MAG: ATP-dependent acyl-CoA ligase [Sphingobium sp.]|nr:ATP-dependent acyl-CoA ligase [Sphingobium sp.]
MNKNYPYFVHLLEQRAAECPDEEAILFVDGPRWTWRDVRHIARAMAQGLQQIGVRQGDYVLSWQPNSPTAVATIFALAYLGAIYVPVNPNYRGASLAHIIRHSNARHMILHGGLMDRLTDIDCGKLEKAIVLGTDRASVAGLEIIEDTMLRGDADIVQPPEKQVADHDTQMVIYTSGTTGPAKGVLSSYRHGRTAALGFRNIGPQDRNLTAMPFYHVGGVYGLFWALFHGGSVVVQNGFSTSRFWSIVNEYAVTTTGLLGSMVDFLNATEPSPEDKNHSLRTVIIAPYGPAAMRFADRFGVDVYTEYNMSELAVPLFCGPNPKVSGTCGVPSPGVELRLVDACDEEVVAGETGELVLRMERPWTISHGYLNDDKATASAWRNGWFHSGDMFRRDDLGHYHFIDRARDSIRRRGENISSFEVESALLGYDDIMEAAAVGVPAPDGTEQEILAVLRVRQPDNFDPLALMDFLKGEIAHHMIPRFIRVVDEFPRTPTQKIEKHRLRDEGIRDDCWDREKAGILMRRTKLEMG